MALDLTAQDAKIDQVISPSHAWLEQSKNRPLKYFIPDWDDLVDPEYDFVTEKHARGGGGWSTEVYAHQIFENPSYDGILVSRAVLEKSKKKLSHLESLKDKGGVHRYLRVPKSIPVMGDCGAFSYAEAETPPYRTSEVLDYYTDYGFNYGISVDHLVAMAKSLEEKKSRYEITRRNAVAFLEEHRERGLSWKPVAAIQGWNTDSYATAAWECVEMGYDYLAIGGLVHARTTEVISSLSAIREAVGDEVCLHVLGIARFEAIPDLLRLNVTSMDSSTYLRRAWVSAMDNYWTFDHEVFAAIRIPEPRRALRTYATRMARSFVREADAEYEAGHEASMPKKERRNLAEAKKREFTRELLAKRLDRAEELDNLALSMLRKMDESEASVVEVLNVLDEYHDLVSPDKANMRQHYWATLSRMPWTKCACAICQDVGVEVIIFRGNNRNRRRGFHNTYVFYQLLGETIARASEGSSSTNITVSRAGDLYPMPASARNKAKDSERFPLFVASE